MFSNRDLADYYNNTQVHYEQWWQLDKTLSLHYGIWENGVKSFNDSLTNTNRVMMDLGGIQESAKVLDAGCGVGGAAIFLNQQKKANVIGVTLSEKQHEFATQAAHKNGVSENVKFHLMDYTQTSFEDESFDVVWACESVSSSSDKTDFIKEAYRLLRKGGKLIMSDFFITKDDQSDPNEWMKKWGATWGISNFVSEKYFIDHLEKTGFQNRKTYDYTSQITKSAKRMYYAALLGAIPSEIYNLFNPNVSNFAGTHYKCGYYQYRALQKDLWKYIIVTAQK